LKKAGIGTSVHWMPLHIHPYYRDEFGFEPSECPCAATLYPELITLPLYPDMTAEDVEYVCRNLRGTIARSRELVHGANLSAIAK
jgi:perosamine synthetase